MTLEVEWVPCEEQVGRLGYREGHCATCLPVPGGGAGEDEWVLCIGGYCEGERDGSVIVSKVAWLPVLRWTTIAQRPEWFECDGASLTRTCEEPPAAYLFGGLNAEMDRCNRLIRITLQSGEGAPLLNAEQLQTYGHIPPPRTCHSAGGTAKHLFIFGGETDDAEQTNDAYLLNLKTLFWTHVKTGSSVPSSRLLAGPLVFLLPHLCILYGGAHFLNKDIKSLSDVWCCDFSHGAEWTQLQTGGANGTDSLLFPRSNGHGGGLLRGKDGNTVVFVGGKDAAEGCDKVKQICIGRNTAKGHFFSFSLVEPHLRGGECPHWRYTPAVVEVSCGLLLLGGHCRHPQDVAAFILAPLTASDKVVNHTD